MDFTREYEKLLDDAWRLFLTLVEEKFEEFAEGIGHWTYALTAQAMPENWCDLLLDELADWEDRGVLVMPGSLQVLHDWVSAVARVRGALPRDPNVVYPEDAWPKFIDPAPNPPAHSTGPSDVSRATLAAVAAAQHVTSLGRGASQADGAPVDISKMVTCRDLLQALVIYRSSLNIRALKILVLARDSGPPREIFISADLLRAFLQLWQIDRQAIMDAATSGRPEDAEGLIAHGVAAKRAAAVVQTQPQPSPAQQNPPGAKLDSATELPYNGGAKPDAPARPQPIALAAGDAEKKQPAGKSETNAAAPGGHVYPLDINDPYGLAGALQDRFVTGKGPGVLPKT